MRLDLEKAPSQPLPSMSMNSRCHMKLIGRARRQQIVHAEGGSEKSEKHFTFKSANRNSIVTAVSNEAPIGMPLFDFVLAKILLHGEIGSRFRVLVVGRHRAVGDALRVGHIIRLGLQ